MVRNTFGGGTGNSAAYTATQDNARSEREQEQENQRAEAKARADRENALVTAGAQIQAAEKVAKATQEAANDLAASMREQAEANRKLTLRLEQERKTNEEDRQKVTRSWSDRSFLVSCLALIFAGIAAFGAWFGG